LNAFSQTIGTLIGSGTVDSVGGGTPVLTVGNNSTNTFSGLIQGTVGLTKVGNGSMTLTGSNPYSGGTVVNAGTLVMGNANAVGSGNSGLTVGGGTLDLNNNNLTLPSLAGGSGVIGNSGTTGTNTTTLNQGNGNTIGMVIGENVSGAKTRLVLLGTTELRLGAANTYSGGTLVGGGAIFALNASGSAGTGPIVLSNNATFYLHNAGGPAVFSGNPVNVPDEN